jgi:catechol 2,3-dioxygenase-like lactoylglutathione lyase family enzyme
MIETKGVVHFTIPVSDPAKSEAFYRDILGLRTIQRVPAVGMVFMQSGDDHVILTRSKTPIDPNPGKEFLIHHAFRVDVDKYDAALAFLKRKGVEIIFEEDRRDGVFIGRQAYFHDPDRNVLEISALETVGEGYGVDDVPADLMPFRRRPGA